VLARGWRVVRGAGYLGIDMKTLTEWNTERHEAYLQAITYPQKNGVACPKCGAELFDSNAIVLMSNPPQKDVHCECGYVGYRVC